MTIYVTVRKAISAFVVLSCTAISAYAGSTHCPDEYVKGVAPEITNEAMTAKARELCYTNFGVMHSGITRTPLWSAEHLTRQNIEAAHGLKRTNSFHTELALPANERAELKDYSRSGFDRGHQTPSGDEPNAEAQNESFSLANMIPQNPNNNRHLWEGIESAVRAMTEQRGELFVITGPLFQGDNIQQLNGRVMVPTHIFKVVYDPQANKAAAYLVENKDTNDYSTVSIAELEKMAGINLLPTMALSLKEQKLSLPVPHATHQKKNAPNLFKEIDKALRTLGKL